MGIKFCPNELKFLGIAANRWMNKVTNFQDIPIKQFGTRNIQSGGGPSWPPPVQAGLIYDQNEEIR